MAASTPLYLRAFPGFDEDLSALPATLADISWRQDPCPRFLDAAAGLALCIDSADPARSAMPELREPGARCRLYRADADGLPEGDALAASDDLHEILTAYAAVRAAC